MAARAPAQQQLSPIKEGGHDKSELEGLRADKEGESKRESKPRGRAMFPFASSLLQCLLMRVRLFFSFFKPGAHTRARARACTLVPGRRRRARAAAARDAEHAASLRALLARAQAAT